MATVFHEVHQQVLENPGAFLQKLEAIPPEQLQDNETRFKVAEAKARLQELMAAQSSQAAPGSMIGPQQPLGLGGGQIASPGDSQAPNPPVPVANPAIEGPGLLRRGYEALTTPSAPDEPNLLTKLGLAISSAAAGFNNPSGPNPILTYQAGRAKELEARRAHDLQQRHYEMQDKHNLLASWLKGATELPPDAWAEFQKTIKPDIEKHFPELAKYSDAVGSSPEARKTAVAALDRHPVVTEELGRINASFDAELSAAPMNKRHDIQMRREAAIESLIKNPQYHKDIAEYNTGFVAQTLAALPKEQKQALKGMTWDQFTTAMSSFQGADGKPLPTYIQRAILGGDPHIQSILSEAYGVETPQKAERTAKEAFQAGENAKYRSTAEEKQQAKEDAAAARAERIAMTKERDISTAVARERRSAATKAGLQGMLLADAQGNVIGFNPQAYQTHRPELGAYADYLDSQAKGLEKRSPEVADRLRQEASDLRQAPIRSGEAGLPDVNVVGEGGKIKQDGKVYQRKGNAWQPVTK